MVKGQPIQPEKDDEQPIFENARTGQSIRDQDDGTVIALLHSFTGDGKSRFTIEWLKYKIENICHNEYNNGKPFFEANSKDYGNIFWDKLHNDKLSISSSDVSDMAKRAKMVVLGLDPNSQDDLINRPSIMPSECLSAYIEFAVPPAPNIEDGDSLKTKIMKMPATLMHKNIDDMLELLEWHHGKYGNKYSDCRWFIVEDVERMYRYQRAIEVARTTEGESLSFVDLFREARRKQQKKKSKGESWSFQGPMNIGGLFNLSYDDLHGRILERKRFYGFNYVVTAHQHEMTIQKRDDEGNTYKEVKKWTDGHVNLIEGWLDLAIEFWKEVDEKKTVDTPGGKKALEKFYLSTLGSGKDLLKNRKSAGFIMKNYGARPFFEKLKKMDTGKLGGD